MKTPAIALILTLTFAASAPLRAQTAEERARIDYEAARIALDEKKPDIALAKLEKVIAVLGELPDLLLLTARAAFESGKISQAKELVSRTFSAADEKFKKSDGYKELISLAARIEVAAPALEAKEKGYWIDSETKLMWTVKDNGYDIDWNRASEYCRALALGGYRGWRLPSIDELQRLYDPRSEKPLKTRGPVELSACCPWSGTMYGASEAWLFFFVNGQRVSFHLGDSYGRALCVRVPEM